MVTIKKIPYVKIFIGIKSKVNIKDNTDERKDLNFLKLKC